MKIGRLSAVLAAVVLIAGCSTTAGDLPAGQFSFVSPGGKTDFGYPAGERGVIGNFTGPSLMDASKTISLTDFPATVVVLNFWGSWCGPCIAEAPGLNVAAELSADRGVQFLGINVRDERQAGADFVRAKQVRYPSIFDPSMRTILSLQGFPTTAIPSTIVLDRDHRVAHIFLGAVTAEQLDTVVAAIAAEGGNAPVSGSVGGSVASSAESAVMSTS